MSDIGFIAPDRRLEVSFEVAPVYNVLATMCMFNQKHLDSISEWIDRTARVLPPELSEQAELACRATAYAGEDHDDFPEWLAALGERDPEELVQIELRHLIAKAVGMLGSGEVPPAEAIRNDRSTHRKLLERLAAAKEHDLTPEEIERDLRCFEDPESYHRELLSFLDRMWRGYVSAEWERVRPMIEDSVRAFRSVEITRTSAEAALKQVAQRDTVPEYYKEDLAEIDRLIFIPSVHIGPYMLAMPRSGKSMRLIVTARIPEGSTVHSRQLERSELLTRLSALSDETRMQILELAAERGAVTSQDVMAALGLTQSSASRHLTQLSATGLLSKDASQKTKLYRLGSKRLDEVLQSLRGMLDSRQRSTRPEEVSNG